MPQDEVSKTDVVPSDFQNAYQLAASGTVSPTVYLTTTVASTTAGTSTVVINTPSDGEGILNGRDHPALPGDLVVLSGTSGGAADGTYHIATVVTDFSFTTVENIATSTGGSINFQYAAGASKIGNDPTNFTRSASTVLSSVLQNIDYSVTLEDEPNLVGTTYTPTYSGSKITKEVWSKTSGGLSIKEIDYTYSGSKVSTEVTKVFAANGSTVVAQTTITYNYSGSTVTSETKTRDV